MFPWSAVILQLLLVSIEFSEVFRGFTVRFADGMWCAVYDTRGEVRLGRDDNFPPSCREDMLAAYSATAGRARVRLSLFCASSGDNERPREMTLEALEVLLR